MNQIQLEYHDNRRLITSQNDKVVKYQNYEVSVCKGKIPQLLEQLSSNSQNTQFAWLVQKRITNSDMMIADF